MLIIYTVGQCNRNYQFRNYKWENPSLFTEKYIININENGQSGYILKVDLEYPQSLHEYHNSYPLCPERKLIKTEMLSKFQLNLKKKSKISNYHVEKLICDLTDKKHYMVHYKNLQLYLQLGMKLKCVHRVLSYNQHEWLKDYSVGNSFLRADAKKNVKMHSVQTYIKLKIILFLVNRWKMYETELILF